MYLFIKSYLKNFNRSVLGVLITSFLFLLSTTQIIAQLPTPIAYYPLNGNTNDVSGNNLNGTNNGATLTTDRCGIPNNAYSFDGLNSSITIAYSPLFDIPINGEYTISAWIKPVNSTVNAIFVKSPFNNDHTLSIWDYGTYLLNGDVLMTGAGQTGHVITSNNRVPTQQCWTHIVATYNNGIWRLYINGDIEGEDLSGTRLITSSNSGISIGKKGEANGDYFNGKIDDVQFYNVELSNTQVKELYDSQKIEISPLNNTFLLACPNDSAQFDIISNYCSNFETNSILWSPNLGLSSSTIINPIATPPSNTTYTANITIDQCPYQTSINVNINNYIPLNLGEDTILCSTNNMLTLDPGNSYLTYLWQDGSTNQTFNVITSGIYELTVQDSSGCTFSDTIMIDIVSPPILNLGNDTSLCANSLTLDARNPNSTYLWQDGSTNQTFNATTSGIYWVEVSNNQCSVTDTINISFQNASLDLGNDTLLCKGSTLVLNAQNPGANYIWQDGSTNQTLNVTTSGTYFVNVTNGSCSISDTITVNFIEITTDFLVQNITGCQPLETYFIGQGSTTNGSIIQWGWDFGDNTNSNIQNPTHSYSESGNFRVTLTTLTDNGCHQTTSKNITITIYNQPEADFRFSPVPGIVNEDVTFVNQSLYATNWLWDFGDNSMSAIQNPIHRYNSPGEYVVMLIISNENCSDTVLKKIVINEIPLYYIPNAFTPGDDPLNQTFQPVFAEDFNPLDFSFNIYNRWGELIFKSDNHLIGWDGSYEGKTVQNDTYIWNIEFKDPISSRKKIDIGRVTIIK